MKMNKPGSSGHARVARISIFIVVVIISTMYFLGLVVVDYILVMLIPS
jgi:hypothetical protein